MSEALEVGGDADIPRRSTTESDDESDSNAGADTGDVRIAIASPPPFTEDGPVITSSPQFRKFSRRPSLEPIGEKPTSSARRVPTRIAVPVGRDPQLVAPSAADQWEGSSFCCGVYSTRQPAKLRRTRDGTSETSSLTEDDDDESGCCWGGTQYDVNHSTMVKSLELSKLRKRILFGTLKLLGSWGARARRNSRWYYTLQVITNFQHVMSPILFAILQHADVQADADIERYVYWVAQGTSVLAALCFAALAIFMFKEKHELYADSRDELEGQMTLYLSKAGPFTGATHSVAFPIFIDTQLAIQERLKQKLRKARAKSKTPTPDKDDDDESVASHGAAGSLNRFRSDARRATLAAINETKAASDGLARAFVPDEGSTETLRALGQMGFRLPGSAPEPSGADLSSALTSLGAAGTTAVQGGRDAALAAAIQALTQAQAAPVPAPVPAPVSAPAPPVIL